MEKYKYYNEYAEFYDLKYEELTPASAKGFKDPYNEWYIGESGGFIFKMPTFINTYKFLKTAAFFKEHEIYTTSEGNFDQPRIFNSHEFNEFWATEEERRKNGMTIEDGQIIDGKPAPLHITGKYYGFLNYGRIYRVPDSILEKAINDDYVPDETIDKEVDFPRFFGSQYMWHQTKEFSRINGFHNIVAKSRRAGYSYMEAWDAADTINMKPKATVILGAFDKKYLTQGDATAKMSLEYLQFLEDHTAFKRLIAKNDTSSEISLGYVKQGQKVISGYKSKILITSFKDNPDAAIGKDAKDIKLEELSNFPNFEEMMNVTEPVTRAGRFMVGQITGFGTGGSKAAKWEIFSRNFYNPYSYNFMPFENIWDKGCRHKVCGYFKSYYLDLEPYIDNNGNSQLFKAKKIVDDEDYVKKTTKSAAVYTVWRSQYARTPLEAFTDNNENIYNTPELNAHIADLEARINTLPIIDGKVLRIATKNEAGELVNALKLYSNQELKELYPDIVTHPFIDNVPFKEGDDVHGCLRVYHRPMKINGEVPAGIYRAWHDPFGIDKEMKDVNSRNSLGATFIYMRTNEYSPEKGDILVASFVGRRGTMEEYNRELLDILDYYNAKLLFENDRGQIINDFKKWKRLDRLVPEPQIEWEKELQGKNNRGYGISMGSPTGNRILRGHVFHRDFIYECRSTNDDGKQLLNLHYIYDLPYLKELRKFNLGGNFDRISAMLVGMYDRKEVLMKPFTNKSTNNSKDEFFKRQKY